MSQSEIGKFDGQAKRWWTSGGSDRYLHGVDAVAAAIRYVANQSGKLAEIVDMSVMIPSTKQTISSIECNGQD